MNTRRALLLGGTSLFLAGVPAPQTTLTVAPRRGRPIRWNPQRGDRIEISGVGKQGTFYVSSVIDKNTVTLDATKPAIDPRTRP